MTEEPKKKKGGLKFLLIFNLLVFIGGMTAGLVIILSSVFPIVDIDIDRMWIGNYILFGTIGYMMIIFMPTMLISLIRRRKTIFSSLDNMRISKIGPYAQNYKPSGAKKPRFCEYCGYEVYASERECPECGGP